MPNKLESNIIIKSKSTPPTGSGFKSVIDKLSKINGLMDRINGKKLVIDVDLKGGNLAINDLTKILKLAARAQRAANQAARAGGLPPPVTPNPLPQNFPSRPPLGRRTRTRERIIYDANGNPLITTTSGFDTLQGGVRHKQDFTIDAAGRPTEVHSTQDLIALNKQRIEEQNATRSDKLNDLLRRKREQLQANIGIGSARATALSGLGYEEIEGRSRKSALVSGLPNERDEHLIRRFAKDMADGSKRIVEFNEKTGEETEKIQKSTKALDANAKAKDKVAREQAAIHRNTARGNNLSRSLLAGGFVEGDRQSATSIIKSGGVWRQQQHDIRQFTQSLSDGSEVLVRYNEKTGKTTQLINRNTQAYRDNVKMQRLQANTMRAAQHHIDKINQGFIEHSSRNTVGNIGGQQVVTSATELRKVTGSLFRGNLQVEIAKIDSATGQLTTKVLRAGDAARALGDTFQKAVGKVSLWFAATSAVYAFSRGVGFAVQQLKELEANTVFMARVGRNLTDSLNFQDRLQAASRLTGEIVSMSAALGGNATEAQRAAAIFLRAGQNEQETLTSVRAALLASSIAELKVEEAANLMSSALAQFRLQANELLPTLDSLNTLSNNYRVTTNDLLQAISRSGSVFKSQGGTLEELAGIVTVVADRTKRSGSEIGNAIKTIQSRLASPEVMTELLNKTGIAMRDDEGNAKSFTKVLMQLQLAMESLNASEQQSLKVRVAGARQVNILENALQGVIDSVVAEAVALRGNGSAKSEAIDNANTLAESLKRLQARFVEVSYTSGQGLHDTLQNLSNVASVALSAANAFSGLGIKVAATVAIFLVVKAAIKKSGAEALITSAANNVLAGSYTRAGAAADLAAERTQVAAAAAMKLNLITLAISASIAALVYAVGKLNQKWVENKIRAAEAADQSAVHASNLNRLAKANQVLTNALEEQISAYIRLNGQKDKNTKLEERLTSNIKRLGNQIFGTGVGGVSTGNILSGMEGNKKFSDKELKELRRRALMQVHADRQAAATAADQAARDAKAKRDAIDRELATVSGRRGINKTATWLEETFMGAKSQKDLLKDLAEASSRYSELNKKAAELKGNVTETADAFTDRFVKGIELGNEAMKELDRDTNLGSIMDRFGNGRSIESMQTRFDSLNQTANKFSEALASINPETEVKQFESLTKGLEETGNRMEQLQARMQDMRFDNFSKQIEEVTNNFSRMFGIISSHAGKMAFIDNEDAAGGKMFEHYEELQTQIRTARAEAVLIAATAGDRQKQAGSPEEAAAAAANDRKHISDLLLKARDLEFQKAEELLKIEQDITKTKKEQNKEIIRSLGLLTNEDKVRVLQQAAFFKKNPNAKISAEQQFLTGADTNKILQQFFGSRLANRFDPNKLFEKQLEALGMGGEHSEELRNAEGRLKGFNLNDFLNGVRQRADQDVKNSNRALGGEQTNIEFHATGGFAGFNKSRGTDRVPAMLTEGEFVVNSKMAKKYKALLQLINRGKLYMADGGFVNPIEQPMQPLHPIQPLLRGLDGVPSGNIIQNLNAELGKIPEGKRTRRMTRAELGLPELAKRKSRAELGLPEIVEGRTKSRAELGLPELTRRKTRAELGLPPVPVTGTSMRNADIAMGPVGGAMFGPPENFNRPLSGDRKINENQIQSRWSRLSRWNNVLQAIQARKDKAVKDSMKPKAVATAPTNNIDDTIVKEAKRRMGGFGAAALGIGGAGAIGGKIPQLNVNANLPKNYFDPLLTSFEKVINSSMLVMRNDIMAKLDKMRSDLDALGANNLRRPQFGN